MPNMTLSLPDEVYRIVKTHKEIRWSEVARRAIEEYAKKLAVLDTMTQKSELSEEDVMNLDTFVKAGIAEHYKKNAAAAKR
jgi:predicted CopG family antitoxin